jgi:hypothetical protein
VERALLPALLPAAPALMPAPAAFKLE